MKVILTKAASFPPFNRSENVGDTIDVVEELANDLIEAGLAEEVKEPEEVKKSEKKAAEIPTEVSAAPAKEEVPAAPAKEEVPAAPAKEEVPAAPAKEKVKK